MAVKGQNIEVVEELSIVDPLTINMVDTKGDTALHINRSNETTFDTAEKMAHFDISAILQEHGMEFQVSERSKPI